LQSREHLAAVADAEGEGVRTLEETLKLRAHVLVEQDRFGPALTRSKHIAIGEAAAGDQALELAERAAASQQIRHMHIMGDKASPLEHSPSLDLTVHTLLAQNCHCGPRTACNKRRRNILLRIE